MRCKFNLIKEAKTEWEKLEEKQNKQLNSLQEGDQIFTMTYKNYKEHYSDCETVAGSFNTDNGRAEIGVIVRAGRMVPSAVHEHRFSTYVLQNKNTKIKMCFYTVCEEKVSTQMNGNVFKFLMGDKLRVRSILTQ